MALPAHKAAGVRPAAPVALLVLAGIGAAFFLIPLIGLVLRTPGSAIWDQLRSPEVLTALRLSLLASLSATAIALVFGVPLAWTLARLTFPGRAVLRAVTVLPMVLPPVVGGVALLLAFGRRGLLAGWLHGHGGFLQGLRRIPAARNRRGAEDDHKSRMGEVRERRDVFRV